jgi:hypothetical protein
MMVAAVAVVALAACEGKKNDEPQPEPQPQVDPREVFVGEYTLASTGNIDLYAAGVKLFTIPLDNESEMTITLGEEENTVWVIAGGDSTLAYVSGKVYFCSKFV